MASDAETVVEDVAKRTWSEDGSKARLDFTSDRELRTEEELLEYGKVDPLIWRVKGRKIGFHQVSMKLKRQVGVDGRNKPIYETIPVKKTNYRNSVELVRIQPKSFSDAADRIFARLTGCPTYKPRIGRAQKGTGDHLVEVGLYDCHFGKYCWGEETGDDYDVEAAEMLYANAVADILDRVRGINVSRFCLPVGNDFFHFDNAAGTTTGGTPLDCDTRYARVIEHGEMAVIHAIETLLTVAPVDVVWVPGNHDRHSSYHLCRTLKARFHDCDTVSVDCRPKVRKYYRFGAVILGYSHGCDEKVADLTRIMAVEVPADAWASSTCREFHVGHFHKSKTTQTVESDEFQGIRVRTIPSLTGTDAWHHQRGYVGNVRAAQALVYDRTDGFRAIHEVKARTS